MPIEFPAVSIMAKLTAEYAPLAVQIAVRQESGLNPAQVGEPDLEKLDAYVLRRLIGRSERLTGILTGLVSPAYVWPFTPAQLTSAYPSQTPDQLAATLALQISTAAEAVVAGTLGDLYNRAAPRDAKYAEQRDYYLGDPKNDYDTGEVGRIVKDVKDMVKAVQQPNSDPTDQSGRSFITSLRGDGDEYRSQYAPPRPTRERDNRFL